MLGAPQHEPAEGCCIIYVYKARTMVLTKDLRTHSCSHNSSEISVQALDSDPYTLKHRCAA